MTGGAQAENQALAGGPARVLGWVSAAAVVVGMVVGAGIFRTAQVAAQGLGSERLILAVWAAGGLFAMAGALCYAELATTFPHAGGDYHFLKSAFGRRPALLYAWSRFAIIYTASAAMLAFVGADYLAALFPLSAVQKAGVAALEILALAALNLAGVHVSARAQITVVALDCATLLGLGVAAVWLIVAGAGAPQALAAAPPPTAAGRAAALVFVMLAYGGFNDAATLSAEVRRPADITLALIGGMGAVTVLYLLANWAYIAGLGVKGLAASAAPAADLMRRAAGPAGAAAVVALVGLTTLSSLNAIVIVGARTLYAAAADAPLLGRLAAWDESRGVPRAALWTQTAISLVLVAVGAATGRGFAAMVDFMAPVYWLFLCLAGAALVRLRFTRPQDPRPYRVPLLPLTAGLFIAGSVFVLAASLLQVGWRGAAASLAVLAAGPLLLLAARLLAGRRGR